MKIINTKSISIWLTGGSTSIRDNKIPKKHLPAISKLNEYINQWKKEFPQYGTEDQPAEQIDPTPEPIEIIQPHEEVKAHPITGSVPSELRKGTFEKTRIKRVTTNGQCFRTEVWKDGTFIYEYHVTIEAAEKHLRDLINQAMDK